MMIMVKRAIICSQLYIESRYPEFSAISNILPGPWNIYGLLPNEMSHCIEQRYFELFAISNKFFGP